MMDTHDVRRPRTGAESSTRGRRGAAPRRVRGETSQATAAGAPQGDEGAQSERPAGEGITPPATSPRMPRALLSAAVMREVAELYRETTYGDCNESLENFCRFIPAAMISARTIDARGLAEAMMEHAGAVARPVDASTERLTLAGSLAGCAARILQRCDRAEGVRS